MEVVAKRVVHGKFPPGNKLGRSKLKNKRGIKEPGIILPKPTVSPRRTPASWQTNCPFTTHQKNYLKMRGYDLRAFYAVNRHNSEKDTNMHSPRLENSKTVDLQLPEVMKRARAHSNLISAREKERISPRDEAFEKLVQRISKEMMTYDQIKADKNDNKQINDIMAIPQLQNLTKQESPRIPKGLFS
ncbi:hypothetical protein ACF0H5_010292 [Mactra antiquata]